jgi:hypothetical protein
MSAALDKLDRPVTELRRRPAMGEPPGGA